MPLIKIKAESALSTKNCCNFKRKCNFMRKNTIIRQELGVGSGKSSTTQKNNFTFLNNLFANFVNIPSAYCNYSCSLL